MLYIHTAENRVPSPSVCSFLFGSSDNRTAHQEGAAEGQKEGYAAGQTG